MQRSNVLFPEPEGPMRHVTSLRTTVRSTPLRTSTPPYDLCTPRASTMASLIELLPTCLVENETSKARRGHHHEVAALVWAVANEAHPWRSGVPSRTDPSKGWSSRSDTRDWPRSTEAPSP